MAPDNRMTRREFLGYSAAGLAATSFGTLATPGTGLPQQLPMRMLGKTGMRVSQLAFGGGSQFLLNESGVWEAMLERAVALGVNYFDTSSSYQWESPVSSEERYGEVLAPIRDRVHLATKFDARDVSGMLGEFERSLRRLKTDYVDVLLIHSIAPTDDIAVIERGIYRELRRLKEEGAARFIGFSSMDSAERSREAIERLEFDVALLAMNPTGYGGFVTEVLPAARARDVGVIAMKVMRDIVGSAATPAELLRYALSQDGVASALVGHHGMETLEENVGIVCGLASEGGAGMPPIERVQLDSRLAPLAGPHALCWARQDYRDGVAV